MCWRGLISKSVLRTSGGDRLSRGLRPSTIGAGGFNGRVRNGIGWNSPAMTTRPAKDGLRKDTHADLLILKRDQIAFLHAWTCFQTWNGAWRSSQSSD